MFISYEIMAEHCGNLSVYSEGEGNGSTFTIEIPADMPTKDMTSPKSIRRVHLSSGKLNNITEELKCNNTTTDIALAMNAARMSNIIETNSKNIIVKNIPLFEIKESTILILVVDDAATNRKMLCRLLSSSPSDDASLVCDEAIDGEDAVQKVKASIIESISKYKVILMDYEMPRLNGPDAVKSIRELGYDGLIIGITGHAGEDELNAFTTNGANQVIVKPVNTKELKDIIIKYSNEKIQINEEITLHI
jgi:CheY-like chemotaxis protein